LTGAAQGGTFAADLQAASRPGAALSIVHPTSEVRMGRINLKGVIVGGLIAGLVLNVFDYLFWGMIYAEDFAAALQALNRPPADQFIPLWIALDFLYGIALVYLYAAIRPRFGPGPGTAVRAGVFAWVLVGLFHAIGEGPLRLFPMRLIMIGTLVGLVIIPLATVVGAKFYKEGEVRGQL
jgi:hypothetical protein